MMMAFGVASSSHEVYGSRYYIIGGPVRQESMPGLEPGKTNLLRRLTDALSVGPHGLCWNASNDSCFFFTEPSS